MKRIAVKMTLQMLLGLTGLVLLAGIVCLNASPQMGGRPSQHDSPDFSGGKFHNLAPTPLSSNGSSMGGAAYDFFFNRDGNSRPQKTLPSQVLTRQALHGLSPEGVTVIRLGHSTVPVTEKAAAVITDPVFNAGKLQGSSFYVPLGVRSHLPAWGIDEAHIHECDWYDERVVSQDLELVFARQDISAAGGSGTAKARCGGRGSSHWKAGRSAAGVIRDISRSSKTSGRPAGPLTWPCRTTVNTTGPDGPFICCPKRLFRRAVSRGEAPASGALGQIRALPALLV